MKTRQLLLITALLLFSAPCFGLDLQTAKDQGLVGETATGYLAAVQSSPEVQKLVDSINDGRKKQYEEIAKRNSTSLQAVEQLAGKKAIEKSKAGAYVKTNGSWQKK